MIIKHVVSFSGGKDSAATLGIALQRCRREHIIAVFADTGNEHRLTLDHLDTTERALGIEIIRLKADFAAQMARKRLFIARDQRRGRGPDGRRKRWTNKAKRRALAALWPTGIPFLDLCMLKGRFPSRRAQFCTAELKRNIIVDFQLGLIDAGYGVISWQGVRRDESTNRRHVKRAERIGPALWTFRPLVDATALQVIAYCDTHDIPVNPLYRQGMRRVGCMPCINVGKEELRQISQRFPEYLRERAEWERLVSACAKRGHSTFFHKVSHDRRGHPDRIFRRENIAAAVKWSQTARGGRQYDLLALMDEPTGCSSAWGLCE